MIDTIKIRLHGILDVNDDTLSLIQKQNGRSNLLVPEHQEIYKRFLKFKNKNYNMNLVYNKQTNSIEQLTDDEFLLLENSKKLTQFYQNRNIMRFVNAKETKEVNLRVNGSYKVPSSSSDINFSINENASYIDFEFSIPKYLYGHNLAQFIPQSNSNFCKTHGLKSNNWTFQASKLYDRLLDFLENRFFVDMMHFFKLDVFPNMDYIEVRRIDLCYNQFFESKQDALTYLENQKKLKKERNYITKKQTSNFGTTYALNSSFGSYFKIYHKGTEYSKTGGDLKKHMKINRDYIDHLIAIQKDSYSNHRDKDGKIKLSLDNYKKNANLIFDNIRRYGSEQPLMPMTDEKRLEIRDLANRIKNKLPFDVIFLKNEMDKVLRYEVSLYGDYFKNLYKRKVFRRKDKLHNSKMQLYSIVKSALDTRIRTKSKVYKEDLKQYKSIHKWLNSSIHLLLSKDKTFKSHETISAYDYDKLTEVYTISSFAFRAQVLYNKTLLSTASIGLFDDTFLRMAIRHFRELIHKHQIKKISSFDDLSSKIRSYNDEVEHRRKLYNEMNHYETLDALGNQKVKGIKFITKATQLLTEKQLREKKLKKVNANLLLFLVDKMQQGVSLEQYRKEAKIKPTTFHRYKKDLEMFDIYENTLQVQKEINVGTDFKDYYWKTKGLDYASKFYANKNHNYLE